MLRLQLEQRWRDTVLVSKGFEWHVEAGPSRRFMFPLEGFDCDPNGYGLALRDGDTFLITPPKGTGQPVRLTEGMRAEFGEGELKLRAWLTREPQATSLAWLWLICGPLGLALLYQLVKLFGVIFAVLLLLLPHPKPQRFTGQVLAAKTVEPKRAVKVRPFIPEVKPPPLPQTPKERLKLLMAGKRSGEIFKDAGKKAAVRERKDQLAKEVASVGMLKLLGTMGEPKYAVLGSLSGGQLNDVFGAGGLGLSGSGLGGGGRGEGIGLGSIGTIGHGAGTGTGTGYGYGSGSGSLSGLVGRELNPAEAQARALAKTAGADCFAAEEGRVLMRVEIDAAGGATGTSITSSVSPQVVDCLKKEIRAWKLPSTPAGGKVTLAFRATP